MTETTVSPPEPLVVEGARDQCGYYTPGMLMAAKYLLDSNLSPTEAEIRTAIQGNICRCTAT